MNEKKKLLLCPHHILEDCLISGQNTKKKPKFHLRMISGYCNLMLKAHTSWIIQLNFSYSKREKEATKKKSHNIVMFYCVEILVCFLFLNENDLLSSHSASEHMMNSENQFLNQQTTKFKWMTFGNRNALIILYSWLNRWFFQFFFYLFMYLRIRWNKQNKIKKKKQI